MQASLALGIVKIRLGPHDVYCGQDPTSGDIGGYSDFVCLIRDAVNLHQNGAFPVELQNRLAEQIKATVEQLGGQFLRRCDSTGFASNGPAYLPEDSVKVLQFIIEGLQRQYYLAASALPQQRKSAGAALSVPQAVSTEMLNISVVGKLKEAPQDDNRKRPAVDTPVSPVNNCASSYGIVPTATSTRAAAAAKPSNAPPKPAPPLSGCAMFFKDEREKIMKETGKNVYDKAMRREIYNRWVNLPSNQQASYISKGSSAQSCYDRELRAYEMALPKPIRFDAPPAKNPKPKSEKSANDGSSSRWQNYPGYSRQGPSLAGSMYPPMLVPPAVGMNYYPPSVQPVPAYHAPPNYMPSQVSRASASAVPAAAASVPTSSSKDPQMERPKSPPSVCAIFFRDQKEKIMAATGKTVYDRAMRFEIAERWAKLSPGGHRPYQMKADELQKKYKLELGYWEDYKRYGRKRPTILPNTQIASKKPAFNFAMSASAPTGVAMGPYLSYARMQRRGMSGNCKGFDIFFRQESVSLRNTEPSLTSREIIDRLQKIWNAMSQQDKYKYDERARMEYIQQRKQMAMRSTTKSYRSQCELEAAMDLGNRDERAREAKTLVTVIVEETIGKDAAASGKKTHLDKALEFSKCVVAITDRLNAKHDAVKSLFRQFPSDNLVGFIEKLLNKQTEFRSAGKSFRVDIGCHNTTSADIESIKTEGLLTKNERKHRQITPTQENGSRLGEGVYTASNPVHFFQRYGSTHLVLLRLKGKELFRNFRPEYGGDFDSVSDPTQTMLRTSAQCAPIVEFELDQATYMGTPCPLLRALMEYSLCLESLTDILLNDSAELPPGHLGYGAPASAMVQAFSAKGAMAQAFSAAISTKGASFGRPVFAGAAGSLSGPQVRVPNVPIYATRNSKTVPPACVGQIEYCMPMTLIGTDGVAEEAYTLVNPPAPEDECAVCMNPLGSSVARLECGHHLHLECLQEAAKRKTACPVCRNPFQKKTPLGHMPTGTMIVRRDPFRTCAGHALGSLMISYRFVGGIQAAYHPNPGERFFPTSRIAYVPDTKEGIRLVSRLQDAFRHGLTFAVGTSLTTGQSNMVCWQSIHHKTNLAGGAHGFPDDNYFRNCNEALDNLHVKPAGSDELLESAF